ncbi:MAG: sugar phosphate isomerase/epimerase [bacterium]
MRVTCSTFAFQGLPLDRAFTRMREMGFGWADVSVHWDPAYGHLQPESVRHEPDAALDTVRAAMARGRVKIAAFNLNTERFALSERGQVEAVCRLAQRADIPVVSVLAGGLNEVTEKRRLTDFVEIGRDHGLVIALETLEETPFQDPTIAAGMASLVPGLKLTLDSGHLLSMGFAQDTWKPLYPHVAHVHLKDSAAGRNVYQVPVGKGQLNLGALVAALRAASYDGALTIEYVGPRAIDKYQFDAEGETGRMREAVERALAL